MIDLDRLRGARDEFGWHYREANAEALEALDAAVAAVLDAPRVWWCGRLGPLMKGRCDHHGTSGLGCGPARVVPVTGEGR